LQDWSENTTKVRERLSDMGYLQKARIHPLAILVAMNTYARGSGIRGSLSWEPITEIVDALDVAFYKSFGTVRPSNKRTMLALDVSGSMTWGEIAGMTGVTPAIGSAAMALITANVENRYMFFGFGTNFAKLNISPRQRLNDVVNYISGINMGGTDCSLPMLYAMKNRLEVDTFVVYTDSETWAGHMHPSQALEQYRQQSGINARLAVVGMLSTGFTIADPNDPGMLDVVGFDTATPYLLTQFSLGEI
jgi:60 kDa SS-A/Ro ribonucleoprotein